jgi:hypothetical protein
MKLKLFCITIYLQLTIQSDNPEAQNSTPTNTTTEHDSTIIHCLEQCVNDCEYRFEGYINKATECKIKECLCDVTELAQIHKKSFMQYLIDLVLIISLFALSGSIVVIFLVFTKREEACEDHIDVNLSAITEMTSYEKDSALDFEYEMITTSIDDKDDIRDF